MGAALGRKQQTFQVADGERMIIESSATPTLSQESFQRTGLILAHGDSL
jgi:hypothetical protein